MSFSNKLKKLLIKAAVISTALLYCTTCVGCSGDLLQNAQVDIGSSCQTAIISANAATPALSARSAVLIDGESGEVLCSKNPDERLPMASTTKIMTALVAIENADLDKTVTIPKEAVGVEGSSIYLYEGEELKLIDLLYALMLESANDAATAIALAVGGSIEGFADMMNQKARELCLSDTGFQNPHGLDGEEHYTTARELGKIAACAMKNDTFREIVSTKKKTIPLNGDEGVRLLINHNKLLKSYDGAIGIKTGYTKKSGRCLVSAAERDGLTLICVTLSAPDDWKDHKSLLDYGFDLYESRLILAKNQLQYPLSAVGGESEYVILTNRDEIRLTMPKSALQVKYKIEAQRFAYAPVSEGDEIGTLICSVNGEVVAKAPLYAAHSVGRSNKKESILGKLISRLKNNH